MKMYKVWSADRKIIFCVECESMDDAYAEIRKIDSKVTTAQACTEEERHQIKFGC